MNSGRGLSNLALEIERQHKTKIDYLVPAAKLRMRDDASVAIAGHGSFEPNRLAHAQIGDKLSIPKNYYDRMLDAMPELLAANVNGWLSKSPDEVRMARTMDGTLRCLVSDKYRPLDYYDMMAHALPIFKELNLEIKSADVTDTRLYFKAISPALRAEVKVGDIVNWGVSASNSEVGSGALDLSGFSFRLACLNGAKHESVFRRNHIGKRNEIGDEAEQFFTNETKAADDKALWLKFRDTLRGILSEEHFDKVLRKMINATGRDMSDPVKTVAVVVRRYGLTQTDGDSLFKLLGREKDYTQYGMAQAVTAYAVGQQDYDKSSELESLGGRIIDLADGEWESIDSEKLPKRELVSA